MKERDRDKIKAGGLYSIINKKNSKSYIGWCKGKVKYRITDHKRSCRNGVDTKIYRAIRKHGEENFEWVAIFDDIKSRKECKRREKILIALFDTYKNGYNSTKGGDGGFTGYNSGQFKKGQSPWNKGKKMSEEYVQKLKDADRSKQCKRVAMIDENGNTIRVFNSAKEAHEVTGVSRNGITVVARGNSDQVRSGGYYWKYI